MGNTAHKTRNSKAGNMCSRETDWQTENSFKIIVVGDSGSGKTSVIQRYTDNQFLCEQPDQLLLNIKVVTMKVPGSAKIVSASFWDIPTKTEEFMKEQYYNHASAIIVFIKNFLLSPPWQTITTDPSPLDKQLTPVVMDAADPTCLEGATAWKKDLGDHLGPGPEPPFLLLANKTDQLEDSGKLLEDLAASVEENGFVACVGVSCRRNDESVHRAVDALLRGLVERGRGRAYPNTQENLTCRKIATLPLPFLGIHKLDELLSSCWEEVRSVNSYRSSLEEAVSRLRGDCVLGRVVGVEQSSVEHCIAAIREGLPADSALQLDLSSSFPQLVVSEKQLFRAGSQIDTLVRHYHDKIFPLGYAITRSAPLAMNSISACQQELDSLPQISHQDTATQESSELVTRWRGCLQDWARGCDSALEAVQRLGHRVQVAALWNSSTS